MTVLDERQLIGWNADGMRPAMVPARTRGNAPAVRPRGDVRSVRARGSLRPNRPAPSRPRIAPLSYRGTGTACSGTAHTRRPVSMAVTVALSGLAALITLWLGSLAHFSGARTAAPPVSPGRLAVVQVQAGETLQHLAGRVAPDVPVDQVVADIKDLNNLESAAVEAGQTLIAPVG